MLEKMTDEEMRQKVGSLLDDDAVKDVMDLLQGKYDKELLYCTELYHRPSKFKRMFYRIRDFWRYVSSWLWNLGAHVRCKMK